MKESLRKEQKHRKLKLLIILLVVIFLVIKYPTLFDIFKNPTKTLIINTGTLSKDEIKEGYIIRQEYLMNTEENRSGIEKIVAEGEKVAKGEKIFKYYSGENIEETIDQIYEIDNQINEAIKTEGTHVVSNSAKTIEKKIEKSMKNVSSLNSMQAINSKITELNDYTYNRAIEIANVSPEGSELKKLINQKKTLEDELTAKSTFIMSRKQWNCFIQNR